MKPSAPGRLLTESDAAVGRGSEVPVTGSDLGRPAGAHAALGHRTELQRIPS